MPAASPGLIRLPAAVGAALNTHPPPPPTNFRRVFSVGRPSARRVNT